MLHIHLHLLYLHLYGLVFAYATFFSAPCQSEIPLSIQLLSTKEVVQNYCLNLVQENSLCTHTQLVFLFGEEYIFTLFNNGINVIVQ